MSKKGQIGIFILLGLIILIGSLLIIYLRNVKTAEVEKAQKLPFGFDSVKQYVESCIKEVGKDGILLIGEHGGYINLPVYSTKDYSAKTAYYFYEDRNIMSSKKILEQELSKYVNEELFFCIRNFIDFKEIGFDIEQGDINTLTTIGLNNVIFKVNFPIVIKKENAEKRIDSFANSVEDIRLGLMYNVSKAMIDEQMKDFNSICLSCLINFGIENDLYIDLQRLDNATILFTITDFNSKIDNLPYKYIFANKYREISCKNLPTNWPEERVNEFLFECLKLQIEGFSYILKINEIPDLEVIINSTFIYDVNATGINVNFTDFTNLFDINKTTGLINFIPTEDDIGNYTIWISAVDSLGNEDFESFELKIKNSIT